MTLRVNVPGAADSGRKFRTAQTSEPKLDWRCPNGHECKGFWTRCLTMSCNEKRPR